MSEVISQLALGMAEISLAYGRPLAHLSAGIYVPGNMRGVMAAGLAGEIRIRAGRTVEDELLAHRPFSLGKVYATGAGRLESDGVKHLAHGITVAEPGQSPRALHVERALRGALLRFDELGARTVTIPLARVVPGTDDRMRQGCGQGALIAGHLRRGSRIRHITVAGLDQTFLTGIKESLIELGAIPIDD